MASTYLTELTMRLTAGALRLPESRRHAHAEFLRSLQRDDGGFPGREGGSDLYYTGFALRALALLGLLDEETARRATSFIAARLPNADLPSVDFMSAVYSDVLLEFLYQESAFARAGLDRQAETARRLDAFRRDDGGYAKTPRSGPSSTYHTFLAVACKQAIDIDETRGDDIVRMIADRQREDGGFVEIGQLRLSGVNPTAAAIGALRLLDRVEHDMAERAAAFLQAMQTPDGGLRANTRIPIGDLLSTFTGLVALHDLDALDRIDRDAVRAFVEPLEYASGGFRGGMWDATPDAEYTFYGVGTLALLVDLN